MTIVTSYTAKDRFKSWQERRKKAKARICQRLSDITIDENNLGERLKPSS